MLEYDIVSAPCERLVSLVNDKILSGWRPIGGPICPSGNTWFQAIIREKKDQKATKPSMFYDWGFEDDEFN